MATVDAADDLDVDVDDKHCSHSRTVVTSSGTEELEVCTQCGRSVTSKGSQFQNGYTRASQGLYNVDDLISEKLKRFVAKDVKTACNEFRFEGQLVNNMTEFVHSFCKQLQSSANCNPTKHSRPCKKRRQAIIVWYIHKESQRRSDHLTVKDICDRLQWPGINPSLVHQMEKIMRTDLPNLVQPFLTGTYQEQDPSNELTHLVSCMMGTVMSPTDQKEVVAFATRLFKCFSETRSTFHHLKNQPTYRVAVVRVTLEHFAAKWQAMGKTIPWTPPKGFHLVTKKLKEELVKVSKDIQYIAVNCDAAKVHRVLDTIVGHIECTEGGRDGCDSAGVEADFPLPDWVKTERQEAITRVQRGMADTTGSGDVPQSSGVREKEDEVVRALLQRGLPAEVILKWPTPLPELLEFSRDGDMNEDAEELGEEDLKKEEEEEYILSPEQVLKRMTMWQRAMQLEDPQQQKKQTN